MRYIIKVNGRSITVVYSLKQALGIKKERGGRGIKCQIVKKTR